jgi:hypothetical protein
MGDRWLAVLAAVLGLLGGMGGAAVGGYVANEGQDRRLEHEELARVRDLRIATYTKFLRAAEAERSAGGPSDHSEVRTAEAETELVAGSAVRKAAARLLQETLDAEDPGYGAARAAFIDVSQSELVPGD